MSFLAPWNWPKLLDRLTGLEDVRRYGEETDIANARRVAEAKALGRQGDARFNIVYPKAQSDFKDEATTQQDEQRFVEVDPNATSSFQQQHALGYDLDQDTGEEFAPGAQPEESADIHVRLITQRKSDRQKNNCEYYYHDDLRHIVRCGWDALTAHRLAMGIEDIDFERDNPKDRRNGEYSRWVRNVASNKKKVETVLAATVMIYDRLWPGDGNAGLRKIMGELYDQGYPMEYINAYIHELEDDCVEDLTGKLAAGVQQRTPEEVLAEWAPMMQIFFPELKELAREPYSGPTYEAEETEEARIVRLFSEEFRYLTRGELPEVAPLSPAAAWKTVNIAYETHKRDVAKAKQSISDWNATHWSDTGAFAFFDKAREIMLANVRTTYHFLGEEDLDALCQYYAEWEHGTWPIGWIDQRMAKLGGLGFSPLDAANAIAEDMEHHGPSGVLLDWVPELNSLLYPDAGSEASSGTLDGEDFTVEHGEAEREPVEMLPEYFVHDFADEFIELVKGNETVSRDAIPPITAWHIINDSWASHSRDVSETKVWLHKAMRGISIKHNESDPLERVAKDIRLLYDELPETDLDVLVDWVVEKYKEGWPVGWILAELDQCKKEVGDYVEAIERLQGNLTRLREFGTTTTGVLLMWIPELRVMLEEAGVDVRGLVSNRRPSESWTPIREEGEEGAGEVREELQRDSGSEHYDEVGAAVPTTHETARHGAEADFQGHAISNDEIFARRRAELFGRGMAAPQQPDQSDYEQPQYPGDDVDPYVFDRPFDPQLPIDQQAQQNDEVLDDEALVDAQFQDYDETTSVPPEPDQDNFEVAEFSDLEDGAIDDLDELEQADILAAIEHVPEALVAEPSDDEILDPAGENDDLTNPLDDTVALSEDPTGAPEDQEMTDMEHERLTEKHCRRLLDVIMNQRGRDKVLKAWYNSPQFLAALQKARSWGWDAFNAHLLIESSRVLNVTLEGLEVDIDYTARDEAESVSFIETPLKRFLAYNAPPPFATVREQAEQLFRCGYGIDFLSKVIDHLERQTYPISQWADVLSAIPSWRPVGQWLVEWAPQIAQVYPECEGSNGIEGGFKITLKPEKSDRTIIARDFADEFRHLVHVQGWSPAEAWMLVSSAYDESWHDIVRTKQRVQELSAKDPVDVAEIFVEDRVATILGRYEHEAKAVKTELMQLHTDWFLALWPSLYIDERIERLVATGKNTSLKAARTMDALFDSLLESAQNPTSLVLEWAKELRQLLNEDKADEVGSDGVENGTKMVVDGDEWAEDEEEDDELYASESDDYDIPSDTLDEDDQDDEDVEMPLSPEEQESLGNEVVDHRLRSSARRRSISRVNAKWQAEQGEAAEEEDEREQKVRFNHTPAYRSPETSPREKGVPRKVLAPLKSSLKAYTSTFGAPSIIPPRTPRGLNLRRLSAHTPDTPFDINAPINPNSPFAFATAPTSPEYTPRDPSSPVYDRQGLTSPVYVPHGLTSPVYYPQGPTSPVYDPQAGAPTSPVYTPPSRTSPAYDSQDGRSPSYSPHSPTCQSDSPQSVHASRFPGSSPRFSRSPGQSPRSSKHSSPTSRSSPFPSNLDSPKPSPRRSSSNSPRSSKSSSPKDPPPGAGGMTLSFTEPERSPTVSSSHPSTPLGPTHESFEEVMARRPPSPMPPRATPKSYRVSKTPSTSKSPFMDYRVKKVEPLRYKNKLDQPHRLPDTPTKSHLPPSPRRSGAKKREPCEKCGRAFRVTKKKGGKTSKAKKSAATAAAAAVAVVAPVTDGPRRSGRARKKTKRFGE